MTRRPIATEAALLSIFQAPSLQGYGTRMTSTDVPETLGRQPVLHLYLHAMTRGHQIVQD